MHCSYCLCACHTLSIVSSDNVVAAVRCETFAGTEEAQKRRETLEHGKESSGRRKAQHPCSPASASGGAKPDTSGIMRVVKAEVAISLSDGWPKNLIEQLSTTCKATSIGMKLKISIQRRERLVIPTNGMSIAVHAARLASMRHRGQGCSLRGVTLHTVDPDARTQHGSTDAESVKVCCERILGGP